MGRRCWHGLRRMRCVGGASNLTVLTVSRWWWRRQWRLSLSPKPVSSAAFAQGTEDDDAADCKAHNACERSDQHDGWAELENIAEYGSDSENNAENAEPQRGSRGRGSIGRRTIRTQAYLQEQRNYADGGDHDQRHGTAECPAAGVKKDQREGSQPQA